MDTRSPEECIFEMDFEPPLSPQSIPIHHRTACHIIEGILGKCTQVEMELQERAMKHVREIGEERTRSSLKRRLMVRLRKDGYHASLCMSSWVATAEHPGGDYEYIDIHVAGEGPSRLIVDTDFRYQFEVARPSPWYAELWSQLPAVFVGPPEKLRKAVALLCSAAQRSLRESGLHVPPWRRSSYMRAKWFPCPTPPPLPCGDAAAVWSVAKAPGGGARMSGLSMELSCRGGSTWTH